MKAVKRIFFIIVAVVLLLMIVLFFMAGDAGAPETGDAFKGPTGAPYLSGPTSSPPTEY